LDKVLIEHCAGQIKAIFTIEEHSIIGGLGSAVAEVLAESRHKGLFRKMALPDKYYSEAGSAECLRRKSGLNAETLTKKILKEYKIFNAGGNHGQG
jgi:transketolase